LPWETLTEEQRRFQATEMAIHAAMVDRMDRETVASSTTSARPDSWRIRSSSSASDNGASARSWCATEVTIPTPPRAAPPAIFASAPDFPFAANTPFRRHKPWVHEGGISTPLIVHWPAGIAARGELRETPAHLIDIVPTILELAGVTKPAERNGQPIPPAPGHSLVPAFAKGGTVSRRFPLVAPMKATAPSAWDLELVAANGDPWELYDLSKDRAESTNLIGSHPEIACGSGEEWNEQVERMSATPPANPAQAAGLR